MTPDDPEQGPPRLKTGQTERLPHPDETMPPESLRSDLDPVVSEDVDSMRLPEVEYEDLTGDTLGATP